MKYQDLVMKLKKDKSIFLECNVEDMEAVARVFEKECRNLGLPGTLHTTETSSGLNIQLVEF